MKQQQEPLPLRHHSETLNGITLHFVSQGLENDGPLVLFCHGFPGLWYSWRKQLPVLAEAGYRVVALDMRGYGGSDQPKHIEDYDLDQVRGDLLALLDHLGEAQAVFVGHDFGAPAVWNVALVASERVQGLIVLSVPYDHDYYGRYGVGHRGEPPPEKKPSEVFAEYAQNSFLHAHYFQQVGPAEAELEAQPEEFFRRIYWALSGEGDLLAAFSQGRPGMGYLDVLPAAPELPWPWMNSDDIGYYAMQYQTSGFFGPLNAYRIADRNWELNARYLGQRIETPTLFIAGEKDPVMIMSGESAMDFMQWAVPGLQQSLIVPDAGHWVQMEQPEPVNQAMLRFLGNL